MSGVVLFPHHKLYRCPGTDDRCREGRCHYCSGGLAYCPTCGGAEGELPTHCPQTRASEVQLALVAKGLLDFKYGAWHRLVPTGRVGGNGELR